MCPQIFLVNWVYVSVKKKCVCVFDCCSHRSTSYKTKVMTHPYFVTDVIKVSYVKTGSYSLGCCSPHTHKVPLRRLFLHLSLTGLEKDISSASGHVVTFEHVMPLTLEASG